MSASSSPSRIPLPSSRRSSTSTRSGSGEGAPPWATTFGAPNAESPLTLSPLEVPATPQNTEHSKETSAESNDVEYYLPPYNTGHFDFSYELASSIRRSTLAVRPNESQRSLSDPGKSGKKLKGILTPPHSGPQYPGTPGRVKEKKFARFNDDPQDDSGQLRRRSTAPPRIKRQVTPPPPPPPPTLLRTKESGESDRLSDSSFNLGSDEAEEADRDYELGEADDDEITLPMDDLITPNDEHGATQASVQNSSSSGTPPEPQSKRRFSDPAGRQSDAASNFRISPVHRPSSFTETTTRAWKRPLHIIGKSTAADAAITVASVKADDSVKLILNTVYEHPGARYRAVSRANSNKTAQTVRSGSNTWQMLWEDPRRSSSSSDVSWVSASTRGTIEQESTQQPSPLERVRTKLAAWSWAKEQECGGDDDRPKWIPLMSVDAEDTTQLRCDRSRGSLMPPAPPNTARLSLASSRSPSATHSQPASRHPSRPESEDESGEEEELGLELNHKSKILPPQLSNDHDFMSRHKSWSSPGLQGLSGINRQLSNVAAEDTLFKTHRDSIDLSRRRLNEERMNQQLMNTRDSIIIARGKFEKYPRCTILMDPRNGRLSCGGLSPILDTSPPDLRQQIHRAMAKIVDSSPRWLGGSPLEREWIPETVAEREDHDSCVICDGYGDPEHEVYCMNGS